MADKFAEGFLYSERDKRRLTAESRPKSSPEPYRSAFRKDYSRLLHSPAFRRLQGKTQLFPGHESDFFRNRLTHSLEVAQIAKSIAIRINSTVDPFCRSTTRKRDWKIDTDLVEFAGLAHDLGHPPFGHNGEAALDEQMRPQGGFEGNAQTLRILAKLEKKRLKEGSVGPISLHGGDNRVGLNLTYRSLASVLKYNREIPNREESAELMKGYYRSEAEVVRSIKAAVTGKQGFRGDFKTIECSIMDIADDIAYSTYDVEDSLKAGFLSLLDFLTLQDKHELFKTVSIKVWNRTKPAKEKIRDQEIHPKLEGEFLAFQKKIVQALINTVSGIFVLSKGKGAQEDAEKIKNLIMTADTIPPETEATLLSYIYRTAQEIQKNGYLRTKFTSDLVGDFINGIIVDVNEEIVPLSKVLLTPEHQLRIEAIKNYTYEAHIMSPRLKVAEYRGQEFVKKIFASIRESKRGYLLMPVDWQELYSAEQKKDDTAWLDRVVCDYISGMTDRYALEFYGRLKSENPQTIFKDH